MRVVVAGAGALGLCVVTALARAGVEVVLADPAPLGSNASGVAAGMLSPAFESLFDDPPEHFELLMRARDLWPAFAADAGIAIERHGALAVSFDEAKIEAWRKTLGAFGVSAAPVRTLTQRRPDLAEGLLGLSIDEDWALEPMAALRALRSVAADLGVAFAETEVAEFAPGRVQMGDGSELAADRLIVASGASQSLIVVAPELAALVPIKGHILEFALASVADDVVRFEGGYLRPTHRGVLVGATMQAGCSDAGVDPEQVAGLRTLAERYMPGLTGLPAEARVGVRASTADGLPIVGPSQTPGVWVAAGARRNGWLLAPMIAGRLVEQLLG